MSVHCEEDIVQHLVDTEKFERMVTIFTPADYGAYDSRPLSVVVREARNPKRPEVTEEVDYTTVTISINGKYGQRGEKEVIGTAMRIYRRLRLQMDVTINDTLYLCINAATPPVRAGFDEHGRASYEITIDIIRYLGGL